jgi:hypothetical protein
MTRQTETQRIHRFLLQRKRFVDLLIQDRVGMWLVVGGFIGVVLSVVG